MRETSQRRREWLLYGFVALPALTIVAFYGGGLVADRWRNLYFLAVFAAALTYIFTVPIRAAMQAERATGLVPRRSGFAGKLELIAERLREAAREIDEREFSGFGPTFQSYVKEVRRVAKSQDKRDLFTNLRLDLGEKTPAASLRAAADEADAYAREVRERGGIYKLSLYEWTIGIVLLAAGFVWGVRLMWFWWDTPSFAFFGGVLLIVSCVVVTIGLVKSQRE